MTANHTAFWWESNGLKFRSQRELEKVIEQFADAGTLDHVKAAKTLMHEAIRGRLREGAESYAKALASDILR